MSNSKCVCGVKVSRDSTTSKIICDVCGGLFHANCVSLNDSDIEFMRTTKKVWKCSDCEIMLKSNRNNDNCTATPSKSNSVVTLEVLYNELRLIKKNNDDFYDYIEGKLDNLKSDLNKIDLVIADNKMLKTTVSSLQYKLNLIEQSQLLNTVELCGLPVTNDEVPEDKAISMLQKCIGVTICKDDIDVCYRKQQKGSDKSKRPGPIVIKFVRRKIKDTIIQAKSKMSIKPADLGLPVNTKIFINESLSSFNRKLLYEAKLLKTKNNLKYLWTRNGIIYMRKTDGSELLTIRSINDLGNIDKP